MIGVTGIHRILLIILALAIGLYRVFVEPTQLTVADTYKDIAHLFVGGLFGAAAMARTCCKDYGCGNLVADAGWFCFWVGLSLSLLELACFLARGLT